VDLLEILAFFCVKMPHEKDVIIEGLQLAALVAVGTVLDRQGVEVEALDRAVCALV
jgi:hypothetical protein